MVAGYLARHGAEALLDEFTEVESGWHRSTRLRSWRTLRYGICPKSTYQGRPSTCMRAFSGSETLVLFYGEILTCGFLAML